MRRARKRRWRDAKRDRVRVTRPAPPPRSAKHDAPAARSRYLWRVLDIDRITEVAQQIARSRFGARRVEDVRVEPMVDWTGADALRVLVVLRPSAVRLLKTTDKAPEMLNDLGERLGSMGEPRFAYVNYATQQELDAIDDPEC